jgi:2-C-methyl-D-erythritol 4-phosphate cytidylyltransferase
MKKFAVIVAGGSGTRMKSATPKQFLLLHGKSVLWYTIQAFLQAYEDIKIILVLPKAFINNDNDAVQSLLNERVIITAGGETRFHSVQNGLKLVEENSLVFVHDGVRCLVSRGLIQRCGEQAAKLGSAIPAVTATDSLRMEINGAHKVIDRQTVRLIQTPQTFRSEIIVPAFEQPCCSYFTDEATVVEAFGKKVYLIEGEYENIKITRPVDLWFAEKILSERSAL